MKKITKDLFANQDKNYAQFQNNLLPGIDTSTIIGVRIPVIREIAKKYKGSYLRKQFIHSLPHSFYDENILHDIFLSQIKDYKEAIQEIEAFLPYIDNWAVCDTLSVSCLNHHKEELLIKIKEWLASNYLYTKRYAIRLLMNYYLDDAYQKEYLSYPLVVQSDDYYLNMMIAWFYATALAKQWKDTFEFIKNEKLNDFVFSKTISKAIDSYRISDKQKELLKEMKKARQTNA